MRQEMSDSGAFWSNRARDVLILLLAAITVALLATRGYLLALVPALLILGFLVLNRHMALAYYLIVALVPCGSFRSLGTPHSLLRLHWMLGGALILLLALHCLPRKAIREELKSKLWPWLGLFLVVSLISALFSRYSATAFKHVALFGSACLFIGVTMIFVSEHGFRKTLPAVIVVTVSLSALLCVIGYFFSVPFFAEKTAMGAFKRGTGTSPDPNNMSLMIIFALPFAFYYLVNARTLLRRALAGAAIFINLLAIITTYSRGGALVLALMMIGLLLEYRRRLQPKHLGLLIALLALFAIPVALSAPASYADRLKSLRKHADSAINQRASYVVVALRAFAQRPLLGYGPGAFPKIYAQTEYAERFQIGDHPKERYAHNTYLEVLIGSGGVGLALFLAVLVVAFRNFSEAKRRALPQGDPNLAILIDTYRLSFAILLIYLLIFSDPYHKYLLVSLGISQVALRVAASAERAQRQGLETTDLHSFPRGSRLCR